VAPSGSINWPRPAPLDDQTYHAQQLGQSWFDTRYPNYGVEIETAG
jgi:hypothetical protein